MSSLVFPPDLNVDVNPSITIEAYDITEGGSSLEYIMMLPMPKSLQVGDSANYETYEAGTTFRAISSASEDMDFSNLATANIGDLTSRSSRALAYKTLADAANTSEAVGGVLKFSRMRVDPGTVLTFQNMNLRSFSLEYTFAPRNPNEQNLIREIESRLRMYSYPEPLTSDGFILKYPLQFIVRFPPHFPGYIESQIVNLQVSYNSQQGLYLRDKTPTDTTITVEFQESHLLNRTDIERLSGDSSSYTISNSQAQAEARRAFEDLDGFISNISQSDSIASLTGSL